MSSLIQSRLGARALLILTLLGLPVSVLAANGSPATEQRIAFYRARVRGGSRATYPLHAQLGLAYLARARETDDDRDVDRALRHFRTSLEAQINYEALLGSALALARRHEFRSALKFATQAAETAPDDPEPVGVLFEVQLALGRRSDAAATLERILNLGPSLAALSRLAAYREAGGDVEGAVGAMREALLTIPSGPATDGVRAWALTRLGALLRLACRPGEARLACEEALQVLPGFHAAMRQLADLAAAEGDLRTAETHLRRLLRGRPAPEHRLALAAVLEAGSSRRQAEAARQRARAVREMRRSMATAPHDRRLLALTLLDDPEQAAEGLDLARQEWALRRDAGTAIAMAWALSQNQRTTEAVPLCRDALATGIADPAMLLRAAIVLERSGDPAEAQRLLERVLDCPARLDPGLRSRALEIRSTLGPLPSASADP